jgi:hypothetical protein
VLNEAKVDEIGTRLITSEQSKTNSKIKVALKRSGMKSFKHFNIILDNTIQDNNSQAAYNMFVYFMVSVQ